MSKESPTPLIGLLTNNIREEGGRLVVSGKCVLKLTKSKEIIDTGRIRLDVPFKKNAGDISFGMRYGIPAPKRCRINTYKMSFDMDEVRDFDIQNKLLVSYGEYQGRVLYDAKDLRLGRNKNSEIFIHDGVSTYFRQNIHNSMFLTVRDTNRYDYPDEQRRIERAYKNADKLKDKDIVLLFEKECRRYEESASVLYEKLIDMGYDNVYFIVDKSIPAVRALPDKYKRNLIDKDSDEHLEYFFASNKFISSETIDHALQLRIANKTVQDKLTGKGLMYVFLQHGVMYMVSLNSEMRVGFRQKKNYKLHKTVVSSDAEARHFIELAGMSRESLYITGLAKFDRSYRNEDADRIIIMPTWRRWETNHAKKDIYSSGYYRMIQRMYSAVPDNLKEKVSILPHPLMAERFKAASGDIGKHMLLADSYDAVLRECSLLVTDYSSIAYDAFYRGANVIFCWEEKDECMSHYGEDTHLMLNEENAFGRITMNDDELHAAIKEVYKQEQEQSYIDKYRRIVEFHDGRNTERIIEHLLEDKIFEPKKGQNRK